MMMWLVLACGSKPSALPARFEDCETAGCREAWILHPDHQDPTLQAAALQTVTRPEERIGLVQQILDINPQQPPEICNQLPAGDARLYCERIQARPHLTEKPPQRSASTARPGGGPSNTELGGLPGGGFVASLTPQDGGCEDATDVRACRSQEALELAGAGRLEAAARSCLAVEAGRWRGECMFSTAEASLSRGTPYAQAFQLCMAAEPFSQQCHNHLLSAMALQAPGATSPARAWNRTINRAEQIAEAWEAVDSELGALLVDRFWSEAVRLSYLEQPVVGDPFDHLPPAAHPHIRAAIAWNVVVTPGAAAQNIEEWVVLTDAASARRAASETPPLTANVRKHMRLWIQDHWATDQPGDANIAATYYFGTARRPLAADPDVDLQLCLLEALARQPGMRPALFAEATASTAPEVAWSAQRLQRTLRRR